MAKTMSSQPLLFAGRFLVLVMLAITGCHREPVEVSGRVTGKVTYQGEPVTEGTILFTNRLQNISMTADFDKTGRFEVRRAGTNGLPPGLYQVSISPPRADFPPGPPPEDWKNKSYPNIPEIYRDQTTSGFSAEVKPGENEFAFDMK